MLPARFSQAIGSGCGVYYGEEVDFCHFASSVMRLHGDAVSLLVLDTLWLWSDLVRASVRLFSTISWLILLTFSLFHISSLPAVISALLGAISQGAEE